MIYFLTFFTLSFFSFFSLKPNKFLNFFLFSFIVFFTLCVGFRYEIGTDWFSYIEMFKYINENIFSSDFGYSIINVLSYKLGYDIIFVNFICSILLFSCILFFLQKTKYPLVNLIVLFPYTIVVVAMNYVRQSVALGFVMLAIYYLVYKFNNFKFILFLFLAFLFHKSAIFLILFLPFTYIKKLQFKRQYFYIFFLIFLLFFIFFFEKNFSKIEFYLSNDNVLSLGALPRIFIHLLPLFIYVLYRKKYQDLNYEFLDFVSLLILFSIPFSFYFSTLVDRLNLYFIIFDIIILDRFIHLLKFKSKILFLSFLILINFFIFFIWYKYSFYAINDWQPYKNYLWDVLL